VKDHLTPEKLNGWLREELPPAERNAIVAHLLAGCQECSRAVAEHLRPAAPVDLSAYDFPLARVYRRFFRQLEDEAQEKEQASGELAALLHRGVPPSRSRAELAGAAGWRWCEEMLEASRELLREDPQGAIPIAALAVTLAEYRLDPDRFAAGQVADLRARARAELGNARRAADDLAGAESDLARAAELAQEGTGAPLLLARITDLSASLFRDQRRLDEAERWLDRVFTLYRDHGKPHLAGRALISKGLILGERQDYAGALRLLEQGLGIIDRARDPHLTFSAVHSVVWFLAESGSVDAAGRLLEASRPLYAAQAGDVDRVKARWVEGKIASGLGAFDDADEAFRETRAAFAEHGKPYDVALVTLDLAAVYLRQGRPSEVGRLATEMLHTFRALGIRREAIAAVILLDEAVRAERLTLALLDELAREFRRLEA
jgi:tetratricopeptide (TPR) repeat protein